MSTLDVVLVSILAVIYLVCIATVAVITFQKGHWVLGIFGFFFPILWLIGAAIPPIPGSSFDQRESLRLQSEVNR
jgi:hypothetical protein